MKKFTQFLLLVIGLGAFSCSQAPSKENSNPTTTNSKETIRIISLSGFLTELLYDLGQGDKIVGRDITSTFPAEVTEFMIRNKRSHLVIYCESDNHSPVRQ